MDLFKIKYGLQQQIERHLNDKDIKGKYILDVGCGYGWLEEVFIKRGAKKVVGIEISEDFINKAKDRKIKNVLFKKASALNIPYRKETFDVAVSFEVLEHIPSNSEIKMFEEVFRVLKPGGIFYLSTPNKALLPVLLDPAWWLIRHRHYSTKQIKNYLTLTGFSYNSIYVRGGIYTMLLLIAMYLTKWIIKKEPIIYPYLLKKSREEYKLNKGCLSIFVRCEKPKINK